MIIWKYKINSENIDKCTIDQTSPYPTINVHNHVVVGQGGKIYRGESTERLPNLSPKKATVEMPSAPYNKPKRPKTCPSASSL